MKTCNILASKVFDLSCFKHVSLETLCACFHYNTYNKYYGYNVSIFNFNYFRIFSAVSKLEPRCVVMQIGHGFIL